MREIVLDTETTGFEPESGDRIVEIGCAELFNHMPTDREYHQYINPERDMPAGAFEVHGIGPDLLTPPRPATEGEITLRDKPVFMSVGAAFREFVGDSKLIIHNAAFDMKFLNFELSKAGIPIIPEAQAFDTLTLARRKFPGAPASLDALCRRFNIDNTSRDKHGALLDSLLLADVYLELIGGRQPGLQLQNQESQSPSADVKVDGWRPQKRPSLLPSRLTSKEKKAHSDFVDQLGSDSVWAKL